MTEYMVSPNPCVIVTDFDNNAKTVTITMGLFWKTWCILRTELGLCAQHRQNRKVRMRFYDAGGEFLICPGLF